MLTNDEHTDAGELRKAAMAERALRLTAIREQVEQRAAEIHEQKLVEIRRQVEAAQAAAEASAKDDPAAALAKFREDVRTIYGA